MNLFFVGLLFLNFGLYAASDEEEDEHTGRTLTGRQRRMIALGCYISLCLMLTICFYRRPRPVNNRTGPFGDRKPYYAGYKYGWIQPVSPPSYNENVSLQPDPPNNDGMQTENPPLYSSN